MERNDSCPCHACNSPLRPSENILKSLYHQLYHTLPREGHSQQENFLTEALVDLMNRFERSFPVEAHRFITEILLRNMADSRSADALARRLELAKLVRWDTQQSVRLGDSSWKRPDITI